MQFGGEFGFYDSVLYESDLFNGECSPILGGAPVSRKGSLYRIFFICGRCEYIAYVRGSTLDLIPQLH